MDSLSHIYNEMHDTDEATDDTDPTKMHEQIDDNENEVEGDVEEDENIPIIGRRFCKLHENCLHRDSL